MLKNVLILNSQHVLREQHDNLTCNNKSLSTVLTIYILAPKNSMNENLQVKFISSNIFSMEYAHPTM